MKNTIQIITVLATAALLPFSSIGADKEKGKGGDGDKATGVFKKLDANDDGKITPKELSESPRLKDKSPKQVAAAFKEKDLNGDGGISEHEFKKSFESRKRKGGPGKGKGKTGAKGNGNGGDDGKNGNGNAGGKGKGGKGGKGGGGKG